jgi:hypothetical protein
VTARDYAEITLASLTEVMLRYHMLPLDPLLRRTMAERLLSVLMSNFGQMELARCGDALERVAEAVSLERQASALRARLLSTPSRN